MTIFEKIVAGEIPCHKVWENEEFLAFLDIRPVARGHTLLIPKKRVDPVFAMEPDQLGRAFQAAQKVAGLLKERISCERVCMAVVGFEVAHAHIHLIPARSIQDFPWPGGKEASKEELAKLAAELRASPDPS